LAANCGKLQAMILLSLEMRKVGHAALNRLWEEGGWKEAGSRPGRCTAPDWPPLPLKELKLSC